MKSSKLKLICFLFIILRAFPFFDGYVNGEVDDQLCYLLGSWKENPALAELKATASHAGVPRVCAAPGSCASWLPQILPRLPVHWVRIHKFPCYSKARQWSLNSNLPQPLKLAGPAPPWVPTQPQTPWAPFTIPGGLPLCCQHLPNLPPTYPAFHASVFWSSITPRSPQPPARSCASPTLVLGDSHPVSAAGQRHDSGRVHLSLFAPLSGGVRALPHRNPNRATSSQAVTNSSKPREACKAGTTSPAVQVQPPDLGSIRPLGPSSQAPRLRPTATPPFSQSWIPPPAGSATCVMLSTALRQISLFGMNAYFGSCLNGFLGLL
ncbi:uncharacterized protein LOC103668580 [Ursus maritimus]|uniref:Uncharacterized protein LOC103668580 n=1 Tax=Ursus maritimus TaxID=29073 RepID=A0A384CKU8_URSMA|nr:uncharacterized protein LOC103668580 [Ursus maritimus]